VKPGVLFPVRALSVVFRRKYLGALQQAFEEDSSTSPGRPPRSHAFGLPGVPHEAPGQGPGGLRQTPFGDPEQVLAYLGRYTHRIAIGNEGLLDSENCAVRFRYRDYAHGNK